MHRGQNMGKPRNCLSLATACRMLNQIVARRVVENDIVHDLFHSTELVETWEYKFFCAAHLARVGVFAFFRLDVDEPLDEEENLILRPDVLPHIGDIDAGLVVVGISLAKLIAHVKGIEEGVLADQLCAEIHLVQIHSERRKDTDLFLEETGSAVTLVFILLDGILVILPRGIALQLHGKNSDAVQEQHKVNALIGLMIYFLHNRENVPVVVFYCNGIFCAVRFSIHQLQLVAAVKLHAVLDDINQPTARLVDFSIDVVNDGFLGAFFIDGTETLHCVCLSAFEEFQKHLCIHRQTGRELIRMADAVAVIITQMFQYQLLVILFFF